jgi:hypothetical protein
VLELGDLLAEILDEPDVRSSIARRANRNVEGVVAVVLDATRSATEPITERRLCGWPAALFPVGYSGTRPIAVGTWTGVLARNAAGGRSTSYRLS